MEHNKDTETRILEILDAFRIYDGVYKKESVDTAIELQTEISPYLLKILESLLANPHKYAEDGSLYDHIYALLLLGKFKETKAHKLIIDIFSLPEDLPDQMFGDLYLSTLPIILLNTSAGSVDLIKSMALNKEADDFCRISACHALLYSAIAGYVSREEIVSFFGTLFTGNETDANSDFWGLLAIFVCDMYPEENMKIIKQAYDDGLIISSLIGYEEFEETLKLGKETCLEKLERDLKAHSIDDLHTLMSRWACFQEQP